MVSLILFALGTGRVTKTLIIIFVPKPEHKHGFELSPGLTFIDIIVTKCIFRVLAAVMSSKYLHPEIREKGGAYGGGAMAGRKGAISFKISYFY